MDREQGIATILDFVSRHRHSYASLAVCRRAIDTGVAEVTPEVLAALRHRLAGAADEEIAAYYSIVT
ncbi:MAG TPA: hypothetical protein VF234_08655 [Limnochordia bacterium]